MIAEAARRVARGRRQLYESTTPLYICDFMSTLLCRIYDLLRDNVTYRVNGWTPGEFEIDSETDDVCSGARTYAVDERLAAFYANLEVPYGSNLETVRRAWKMQMKKYHPDMHAANIEKRRIANEISAQLTTAYRELECVLAKKEKGNVDV